MHHKNTFAHIALVLVAALPGCALEKSDDVAEYREALPESSGVQVDGPETSRDGSGSSLSSNRRTLADGPSEAAAWAEWYAWTREVRDGVNAITGAILGSVQFIVHTRPTSVGDDVAIWGPYQDPLEPAAYRLVVERVGEHEYDYRLEGRPKGSTDDDDFLVVLSGTGYDRLSEHHGDGSFSIDLDNARQLDPLKHIDDSGSITIRHDLPQDVDRNLGALPRVIEADIRPASEDWLTIASTANEDGTGMLDVNGYLDIDDAKDTLREDISILSRWRISGAGRADITIAGGDVPEELGVVTATECWGTDFARVYYGDTIGFAETEGDPGACVYDEPSAG